MGLDIDRQWEIFGALSVMTFITGAAFGFCIWQAIHIGVSWLIPCVPLLAMLYALAQGWILFAHETNE